MKLPSPSSHNFATVPRAEIPRSQFDRSFSHKTTLTQAGLLYPVYVDEALPGDTFNMKMTAFARLATPLFPLMDNMYLESFFFAVPNRLVWDNWERFNGAQTDPADSTDYTIPKTGLYQAAVQARSDYMGIPPGIDVNHSVLWHRAYNLIWNEWFRDQNLQDSVTVETGDTTADMNQYDILYFRGKRHDYFTSCLPFPQKGDSVVLPLGTSAPVVSDGTGPPTFDTGGPVTQLVAAAGATPNVSASSTPGAGTLAWNDPRLEADLSTATSATINDIREAFQVQKLLERDARGGTRYTEIVKAHFGVTSPDARLQRPEYLGGGSTPVNISPIAQTAEGAKNVGDLAAIGTAHVQGHGFTKSFTEHCLLIGLVCVRADLTYQQGVERQFFRDTRYDFYWPALAHLGEQAVLRREIELAGDATDDDVFGYQERYAEYRYKPSLITGKFRSSHPFPLDAWHLAQEFSGVQLNDTFIRENPPLERVVAVSSEDKFLFDSFFRLRCARPMPVYGVPGLTDHF